MPSGAQTPRRFTVYALNWLNPLTDDPMCGSVVAGHRPSAICATRYSCDPYCNALEDHRAVSISLLPSNPHG